MSFLFGAKPQLSSAEKIANAETEVEMVSDMFNRFSIPQILLSTPSLNRSLSYVKTYR